MAESVRVRKNIDDLTEDELSNYLRALERLYAIAAADPESIDGYTFFEQLHDGDKGPCEHANDTFLRKWVDAPGLLRGALRIHAY